MSVKKGILYVLIANIINLLVGLFAGFVLPKMLSIETYSDIRLFQLYITYLGILHFGFSDGMYLRHGGKSVKEIDKREVLEEFKTFKVFQLVITILAIIVSIVIRNKIIFFCSLVILPVNVGNYLRSLYQATGEFKKYSRFTNVNTLMIFIINLVLLFIVRSDDPSLYIALYIVAYFGYWLVLEVENKKIFGKEKVKAKTTYLKSDIKTGFFLMTGNFCNVIFTSIDRLFVQFLMGKIKFAFYSFAVSVENLINTVVNPVSIVMYNYLCKNREKDRVVMLKRVILIFGAVILLAIYPAKFIIVRWLPNYVEAIPVLFLLFGAQFASILVRCIHINLYKSNKKQNRYFVIMVGIVALAFVLNMISYNIVRTMEIIAVATLITNIVWLIVGEVDLKKYALGVKDYIYTGIIMSIFLGTMFIDSSVIGFVVFAVGSIVATMILLPDTTRYIIEETGKTIRKIGFRNGGK